MVRKNRFLYGWSGGELGRIGTFSEARLRAWEYDRVAQGPFLWQRDGATDVVHLWRTRRPDLSPAELWVGEVETLEQG